MGVTKWGILIRHSACCVLKHNECPHGSCLGYMMNRHFYHGVTFLLERLRHLSFRLGYIWQAFSQKWVRWACHFKENYLLLLKIASFHLKIRILENLYLLRWAWQLPNTFDSSDGISGDTNRCNFLYHIMESSTSDDLHRSMNCFPNNQWVMLQSHALVKDPSIQSIKASNGF